MPRTRARPQPFSSAELATVPRLPVPASVFEQGGGGTAFFRPEFGTVNVYHQQPGIALLEVQPPPATAVTLAYPFDRTPSPALRPDRTAVATYALCVGYPVVLCANGVPVAVLVPESRPV